MIDVIAGEEPPLELGDENVRNFSAPHFGWLTATVAIQLVVLFFIAAAKLHAMPQTTALKVQGSSDFVRHDRFRGSYIEQITLCEKNTLKLFRQQSKPVVLIFKSQKLARILNDESLLAARLEKDQVAVQAKISQNTNRATETFLIEVPPFYLSEAVASSLQNQPTNNRDLFEFQLAVDKEGRAVITSMNSKKLN